VLPEQAGRGLSGTGWQYKSDGLIGWQGAILSERFRSGSPLGQWIGLPSSDTQRIASSSYKKEQFHIECRHQLEDASPPR
jgi:hypothetical protein